MDDIQSTDRASTAHPGDAPRHTNRLAQETSPYLLQHAHNPVDWYPWGPEALARARDEDRPIFLSVGYAACHWCHVMERESFEDEATAEQLNADFVSVKVDREERPDIDSIYMDAVQQMTGQGGWPMSVFLTPDGKPFYGGTYFPGQPRYGMPSFRQVLDGVARAWREQRDQVEEAGTHLAHSLTPELSAAAATALETRVFDAALTALQGSFDRANGGWGGAPKFPQPMAIEWLLREYLRTRDDRALSMATTTLDRMAAGGIYDHLGGGFERYATDSVWLVPHFEKMLYDNAQLARVYLHAWQLTARARYRDVVEETLDYVVREMRVPEGGFTSSQDADTEGEEGLTYVWDAAEIRDLLGDDAPLFVSAYSVTDRGNWEGRTILARAQDDAALAMRFGIPEQQVKDRLLSARQRLLSVREQRPQPGRDDKVLTGWNGLMIAPFAEASRLLQRPDYLEVAVDAARFLVDTMLSDDGRLRRSWKDGRALHNGVLEDYTHLADGLLALYEHTFDERWFATARTLMDSVLEHFADERGGFWDTSDDHEQLIARPKGLQDGALPSGNAMAVTVLLRLAALTGEPRYQDAAESALRMVAPLAARYPTAFPQWLVAMTFAVGEVDEVAIVGELDRAETRALADVPFSAYRPLQVVAAAPDGNASQVPLLAERPLVGGVPTAYVCRSFACRQPVTDPAALADQLGLA